ncbi:MAG: 4'-phosphopantetheinyl transferase superfamily protein [Anaerolineae bacterium]|nr:4'-phosphopantetheinyl transferase superfamily protein [Anaerolineae bacterium]
MDIVYWTVGRDDLTTDAGSALPFEKFLTSYEIERLSYLRFPKRRAEWLLGRWTIKYLLRHSIPAFNGWQPGLVQVKNEPEGMPYLENTGKQTPLPANISISHRDHYAFCAITGSAPLKIGVDIELIESRPPSFLEDFFTQNEYQQGLSFQGYQRDVWFTLIWSLKESVLKALGKGLRLDTRCVEVRDIGVVLPLKTAGAAQWFNARVVYEGEPDVQWCAWWRKQDRFVYTLAARLPDAHTTPQLQEVPANLEE